MTLTDTAAPAGPGVATRQDPYPGFVLGDRYRLVGRLAVPGTGQVWRAHDPLLDRRVAVKRVDEVEDAAREARAASSVGHRGVVRVYDLVDDPAVGAWLVMEELTGSSLAEVLVAEGRLGAEEAASVGRHLLEALAAVHAADLVHRDVKPSNVSLGADGRVVLLDFGLAVRPCTTGGAVVSPIAGSLPYLAPEIVEHGRYSASSDLFALGMTLFTAVSGEAPAWRWSAGQGGPDLTRLRRRVSTRLTGHPELLAVIFGLLERHPSQRPRLDDALAVLTATAPAVLS